MSSQPLIQLSHCCAIWQKHPALVPTPDGKATEPGHRYPKGIHSHLYTDSATVFWLQRRGPSLVADPKVLC